MCIRDRDRDKAICKFCDTDFWGMDGKNGGNFSKEELTDMILSLWPKDINLPVFLVCTGGEPGLQMDEPLVTYLHKKKVEIAIETNGTVELPTGLDWVCVSPVSYTHLDVYKRQLLIVLFCPDRIVCL